MNVVEVVIFFDKGKVFGSAIFGMFGRGAVPWKGRTRSI